MLRCAVPAAATAASRAGLMKISSQAQDLVFELLSDKVTDLLDSSLMFIEVGSHIHHYCHYCYHYSLVLVVS